MKGNLFIVIACLSIAVFVLAQSDIQAQDKGKKTMKDTKIPARIITATVGKMGQHPGTVATSGPAKIVCLKAISNLPNPQPKATCFVQAPGYSGTLDPPRGEASASGAGTIILICNGQGDFLRCSARVQEIHSLSSSGLDSGR